MWSARIWTVESLLSKTMSLDEILQGSKSFPSHCSLPMPLTHSFAVLMIVLPPHLLTGGIISPKKCPLEITHSHHFFSPQQPILCTTASSLLPSLALSKPITNSQALGWPVFLMVLQGGQVGRVPGILVWSQGPRGLGKADSQNEGQSPVPCYQLRSIVEQKNQSQGDGEWREELTAVLKIWSCSFIIVKLIFIKLEARHPAEHSGYSTLHWCCLLLGGFIPDSRP